MGQLEDFTQFRQRLNEKILKESTLEIKRFFALDNQTYQLMIQDLAGGEPVSLGSFEAVLNPSWTPDGSQILFSAGPWDNQKLFAVKVSDGSAEVLGQGTMLDVVKDIK